MSGLRASVSIAILVLLGVLLWALDRPRATSGGSSQRPPSQVMEAVMPALIPSAAKSSSEGVQPGRFVPADPVLPAPEYIFTDGEGNPLRLTDMKGRVVVLNLWATWCGPCVREMPLLDHLQEQVHAQMIDVVAVSLDRQGAPVVRAFYEKAGIRNLPIRLDRKSSATAVLSVRGLPTTFIIDRDGDLLGKIEGEVAWDDESIIQFLLGVVQETNKD